MWFDISNSKWFKLYGEEKNAHTPRREIPKVWDDDYRQLKYFFTFLSILSRVNVYCFFIRNFFFLAIPVTNLSLQKEWDQGLIHVVCQ